jgi:hypothetical protein
MREKILPNLFLSFDYDKGQTKSGIITGQAKYYLIGILPIILFFKNGAKKAVRLKERAEISLGDPYLQRVVGTKADDKMVASKYSKQITKMVNSFASALKKAQDTGKFANQEVKEIKIIKF